MNENWRESYGGHFEMWDRTASRCEKKVLPVFNRSVIFSTGPDSFHGHPDPLTCPDNVIRKSIALYYFTEEVNPVARSTEYRARPSDPLIKKAVVFGDKAMIRGFDWMKRRLGVGDRLISRLLGLFVK